MTNQLKADIILHGNQIFTSKDEQVIAGFIAIKDNKIITVEQEEGEMKAYVDDHTKVIDCSDKFIMPGFHDSHTHLTSRILLQDAVDLYNAKSEQEAAKMTAEHAETLPTDTPLIIGTDWNSALWQDPYPTKASLDKWFPDRPVFLAKLESHGAWLNSKGLELFGIDRHTKDVEGGKIFKDASGEPTGYVDEKAALDLFGDAVPIIFPTAEAAERDFKKLFMELSKYGITAVCDLHQKYEPTARALKKLEERGELNVRFGFSTFSSPETLAQAKEYKSRYCSDMLRFLGFKYMYDGTLLGYTGELLEPYDDLPDTTNIMPVNHRALLDEIIAMDREGYRVRIHCIGDGAVRRALDIFEECRIINGKRDSRHSIAHIEVLQPEDARRFAELGVIADIHPAHIPLASEKYEDNVYPLRLGRRREAYCFNYRTLQQEGAVIAMGSDVPVVAPDPFLGIYRAVTRKFEDGLPEEGWLPEQKLRVGEVLRFYTIGSAYHAFMEDKIGTLEVGKLADLIVLDRNLLQIPPEQIRGTKVLMTICDGNIVYTAND